MDRLTQAKRIVCLPNGLNKTTVAERIVELMENYKIERALWLVQPGLSASKLSRNPANKAHALLNHLNGICTANNVYFTIVTSL